MSTATTTMPPHTVDPASLVRPRRVITGMSAILLPMKADDSVDWDGFAAHVARTSAAGITPAINMDTGYVQLIDDATRCETLRIARDTVGPAGRLVAGACVVDAAGAAFDEAAYGRQIEMILAAGATPVIFPSHGLTAGGDAAMLAGYRALARRTPSFIGFELSTAFVPCGRMLSLEGYAELLAIPNCMGAKHSSLSRRFEWERLALRDRTAVVEELDRLAEVLERPVAADPLALVREPPSRQIRELRLGFGAGVLRHAPFTGHALLGGKVAGSLWCIHDEECSVGQPSRLSQRQAGRSPHFRQDR